MAQLRSEEDRAVARSLVAMAEVAIVRVGGGNPAARTIPARAWAWVLDRLQSLFPSEPVITAWRDAWLGNRLGWRERAAYLRGHWISAVDYQTCRRCRLGWVEESHTVDGYERLGLAAAALAALRSEHPGLEWHTLGGHLSDAIPFWEAVGDGIPGGYRRRKACPHIGVG